MANETLRETLNRADPNSISDTLRSLKFGDMSTRTLRRRLTMQVPRRADVTIGGTAYSRIRLPNDAKAMRILRAWARAGGGTLGNMTVHTWGAVPGANEIAVGANGDLLFLDSDAYTLIDVEYEPIMGDVVTLTGVTVVPGTGVCTLPTPALGSFHVISATSKTGTLVADMLVDYPNTTAPATTIARMNLVGTVVFFAIADAVTSCDLVLVKAAAVEPGALLVADSATI